MKTEEKKKKLLDALRATLGNITLATREVGICRDTFYDWKKNDEEFAKQYDDILEEQIDFAENSLFEQIKEGNPTATIFFLKTKGKKRGYVEKTEVNLETNEPIQVIIHEELP